VDKYRTTLTLRTACGLDLPAGAVFDADEVNAGSLEAMKRLGQCEPVEADEPLGPRNRVAAIRAGELVTMPAGFTVAPGGPSEEDHRAAVAEIYRLRRVLTERSDELAVAKGLAEQLRAENERIRGELVEARSSAAATATSSAAIAAGPAEVEGAGGTEPEPPAAAEKPAPAKPAEAKPKAPAIGPTKAPDLKTGKK
jgi:hypothetical protein